MLFLKSALWTMSQLPSLRLAVFDLDYTVWQPEMYQLNGAPKLESVLSPRLKNLSKNVLNEAQTRKDDMILFDGRSPIRTFPGASYALSEINTLKKQGVEIQAAVASRTDQPSWAKICMEHLVIDDGTTLSQCFGRFVEISYDDKKSHFERLHKKTGIPYEEMCFFDNEYWNIKSVSGLGVKCIYTPDGMTRAAWDEAKKEFSFV